MINKHMKRCSTSLLTRKNANQNHNRYHFICEDGYYPKNKTKKTSVGQEVEKLDPSCTAGWNVKYCSCYGK